MTINIDFGVIQASVTIKNLERFLLISKYSTKKFVNTFLLKVLGFLDMFPYNESLTVGSSIPLSRKWVFINAGQLFLKRKKLFELTILPTAWSFLSLTFSSNIFFIFFRSLFAALLFWKRMRPAKVFFPVNVHKKLGNLWWLPTYLIRVLLRFQNCTINSFLPSVTSYRETSHVIWTNRMTGFFIKWNIDLVKVNDKNNFFSYV